MYRKIIIKGSNGVNDNSVIPFVDKDTTDSGVEETPDRLLSIYTNKICQVIEKIAEMGIPKPGEQIRLITKRSFNAVAFLQYLIEHQGAADNALLCIYSISYEAAQVIDDLINLGKIKRCTILMSSLRNIAYRTKEEATKELFLKNPNIRLIFACSHAKIMSFKIGDNYYTVEGSGNLSFNSRVEQYTIDNSQQIYDFTVSWTQEICEYFKHDKRFIDYGLGIAP